MSNDTNKQPKLWPYLLLAAFVAVGAFGLARNGGVCGFLGGDGLARADAKPAPALATAPAWSVTDLDGKAVSSASLSGKVVLLNFWATWCPPCVAEIPDFIALQQRHASDGLAIVGASVDSEPDTVRDFAQRRGMNYTVAMADPALLEKFGPISVIPVTLLIDRDGRIVRRFEGRATAEELDSALKGVL